MVSQARGRVGARQGDVLNAVPRGVERFARGPHTATLAIIMATVEIRIAAISVVLPPGAATTTRLGVRNTGDEVETFTIRASGPLAAWTQVSPDVVRLWPGEGEEATLSITPPPGPELPAGEHHVGVNLSADDGSVHTARTPATVGEYVAIGPPVLQPDSANTSKTARFDLAAANTGNAPVSVQVQAEDATNALELEPARTTQQAPVAGGVNVAITATCRKRRLWGDAVVHPFTVTVTSGSTVAVLKASVRQTPSLSCLPIALGVMALLLALLGLGAWGLGLFGDDARLFLFLLGLVLLAPAVILALAARRLLRQR